MTEPQIWYAIPSAHPERCRATLTLWRSQGYATAVLADASSTPHNADFGADLVARVEKYEGWAASVNHLCTHVLPADCAIIVTGGDDVLPDPNHDAATLARQFLDRFPDTFGVMQPRGDGFMASHQYCGSPFLGRAWCRDMYSGTGPLYARYRHNYADNELQWLARGMGVLWDRHDLTHRHEHFSRASVAAPAHWAAVVNSDLRDCMLYFARAYEDFPGHAPRSVAGTHRPTYRPPASIDAMTRLAEQRMIHTAMRNPFSDVLSHALQACAAAGHDPVGIYGYGLFTQAAAAALREPPVTVTCIIDDDPQRCGRTAWNIPIVSREHALRLGLRAVILGGLAVQDALWDAAAPFRDRGIKTLRLDQLPQADQHPQIEALST